MDSPQNIEALRFYVDHLNGNVEAITIATVARRLTAALSRPTAEIEDDVADVHTLRRELRRLRAEVLRLEEDKRVLEERVAFLGRELEETRAKIPRGLSTS